MHRLFICYASKDLPFIEELRTHLSALPSSVQLWYDRRIGIGEDWPDALRRELNGSTHLLACLSPDMIASAWCRAEWEHALANDKPVFPLRVRAVNVASHEVFGPTQCHPPLDKDPIVTGTGDPILRDKAWADAVAKIAGWLNVTTQAAPRRNHRPPPPPRPLSALRLEAAQVGDTWQFRTAPDQPVVATAPIDRELLRGAVDGSHPEPLHDLRDHDDPSAAAGRLGDALGRLLLPGGPLAAMGIDPAVQVPTDRGVRCRLHTSDEALLQLPWSLARHAGRYLTDDGWTFELVPTDRPSAAHVIVRAPAELRVFHPKAGLRDATSAAGWQGFRDRLGARLEHFWGPAGSTVVTWSQRCSELRQSEVVVLLARCETVDGETFVLCDPNNPVHGQEDRRPLSEVLAAVGAPTLLLALLHDPSGPVRIPATLAGATIVPTVPIVHELEAAELAQTLLTELFEHGRDPIDAVRAAAPLHDSAAARGLQVRGAFEQWTTRRPAAAKRFNNHAWYTLDRRAQRERTERIVRDLRLSQQTHRLHLVIGLSSNDQAHRLEYLSYILLHDLLGAFGGDLVRHDLNFPSAGGTSFDPAALRSGLLKEIVARTGATSSDSASVVTSAATRWRLSGRSERPVLWLDWGCLSRARPVRQEPDTGRLVDPRRRPLVDVSELTVWLEAMRDLFAGGVDNRQDLAVVCFISVGTASANLQPVREHVERWPIGGHRLRVDVLSPLESVSAHDIERFLEDEVCAPTCPRGRAADIAWWLYEEFGGDFDATAHAIETKGEPEGYARWVKLGPRPPAPLPPDLVDL